MFTSYDHLKTSNQNQSVSKTSTHNKELGEPGANREQGIPGDSTSAKTKDEEEIYESENEYHDAISDLRELTTRLNIDTNDKNMVLHETMKAVGHPKSPELNKETASDSGIDEEEEYFEPMAMEPPLKQQMTMKSTS